MSKGGRVYKIIQPYAGRKHPRSEKVLGERKPITITPSDVSEKEPTKEEILVSGLSNLPSKKAREGIYKTIIKDKISKPKGTREYLGKERDTSKFGFRQKDKLHPEETSLEYLVGKKLGITKKTQTFERAKAIHQKQQTEWEAWTEQQRELDKYPVARDISHTMSNFLVGVNPEYILGSPKDRERIARGYRYGVWKAGYKQYGDADWLSRITTGFLSAAPTQYLLLPTVTGYVGGVGLGALSAAYPTTGKIVSASLGLGLGYQQTRDIIQSGKPYEKLLGLGLSVPFSVIGFRKGFKFGYGKAETHLYKIHTYDPGSSGFVRFEQAIKLSRLLKNVKSHKIKPIDVTKDVLRVNKKIGSDFLKFYGKHKGVVGGSAASYTQVEGARMPRDIDYFLQRFLFSTKTRVAFAKQVLTTRVRGKHVIDVHGKEMYHPGKYHRFGFESLRPVKIAGIKFFTAGEQLFRKGVASVTKEAEYRWFKDIPDFVVHAKSLITSAKIKGMKVRALKAEASLDLFLHPEKSSGFGKDLSFINNFLKQTTKPVPVKLIETVRGLEYIYPKSIVPSYYIPLKIGGTYGVPQYKAPVLSYQGLGKKPLIPSFRGYDGKKLKSVIPLGFSLPLMTYKAPAKDHYKLIPRLPKKYLHSGYKAGFVVPITPREDISDFFRGKKKKPILDFKIFDFKKHGREHKVVKLENLLKFKELKL